MQSLSLESKIGMSKQRIRGWVDAWKRYEIINEKTAKVRYVTDTEEPTTEAHWVEVVKRKKGKDNRLQKERLHILLRDSQLVDYVLRSGKIGGDGYWQPTSNGMGYWFVIEWLNIHDLGIVYYTDIDYAGTYGNDRTREILRKEKIKVGMKRTEKRN